MLRTYGFALAILGFFSQIVAWSTEVAATGVSSQADVTTNRVTHSLALALEAWDAHLATPGDSPETHEWKLRNRLVRDPFDTAALDGLVKHFYAQGEFVLAVAAAQYAGRSSKTNFTTAVTHYDRGVNQLIELDTDGKAEGDMFTATRLDMLRDTFNGARKQPLPLEKYRELELGLRDLLADTAFRQDALILLAKTCHHRRDWSMTAMLSMLALRFEPSNVEMIDLCLEVLSKPAYEPMQLEMIKYFASRDDLTLSLTQRFIKLGRNFDKPALIQNFYVQAVRLDPENPERWQDLGDNLYALRKYPEAMKALSHAATLPDHHFSIYYTLALIGTKSSDVPAMAFWLGRWRAHVGDEQLSAALMKVPFKRYPRLLQEIE